MKLSKLFSLLIVVIFIPSFGFAQSTYYVSTSGNNANNGALTTPWLTIQYGVNQLLPGDTLFIKAGTYFEKVDVDVSGTAAAKITIKNFANDEVIVSGANSSNNNSIIWTDNAYLTIEGLHITDNQKNFSQGLTLQGTAHHILIKNNKVSKINFSSDPNAPVSSGFNSVPLSALGDDADSLHHIDFIANEVFNNRTGYSENLTIGGNVTNFKMIDNIIHDNTNIGIDATGNYGECPIPSLDHPRNGLISYNTIYNCSSPYSPAAGIYIDGGAQIMIENNLSHHNGYGGEIGCEQNGITDGITFRNNIFHHNLSAGMHIGGYDNTTTGVVVNSNVYNNVFYENDTNNWNNGELILSKSENCKIDNNIFYISAQNILLYAYRIQTNLSFDYNLVYSIAGDDTTIETTTDGENNGGNAYEGLTAFYGATGYGANSLFGDPLFVNLANGNFHILNTSPAINSGDPNYIPTENPRDIDYEIRLNGVVDMGVDEYYAPLAVTFIEPLSGVVVDGNIALSWEVAEEINTANYKLQKRTTDSNWETIETNLAGKSRYTVLDVNPTVGMNTYRLYEQDKDGYGSYSNTVNILYTVDQNVYLYPNPSLGTIYISNGDRYIVTVNDLLGRMIYTGRTNRFEITQKGMFLVTIRSESGALINKELISVH